MDFERISRTFAGNLINVVLYFSEGGAHEGTPIKPNVRCRGLK